MTRPSQIRFRRPPGFTRRDDRTRYLIAKLTLIESEMAALRHEQSLALQELDQLAGRNVSVPPSKNPTP